MVDILAFLAQRRPALALATITALLACPAHAGGFDDWTSTRVGGTGTLLKDTTFHFDPATNAYSVTSDFEPIQGYWTYACQDADIVCAGIPVAADWDFNTGYGWHLVSTAEAVPISELPADVFGYAEWDTELRKYNCDVQQFLPRRAYWMFRESSR